jgi:hypothetical protein
MRCTQTTHLSPRSMILPAEGISIRLKTRAPLRETRIRDQEVGGSNPLAPTISQLKPAIYEAHKNR